MPKGPGIVNTIKPIPLPVIDQWFDHFRCSNAFCLQLILMSMSPTSREHHVSCEGDTIECGVYGDANFRKVRCLVLQCEMQNMLKQRACTAKPFNILTLMPSNPAQHRK